MPNPLNPISSNPQTPHQHTHNKPNLQYPASLCKVISTLKKGVFWSFGKDGVDP